MFKKLKDKIAEQSPLKLPASVQQFAQAVVSSTSSAVLEPVTLAQQLPADPFSIGDDLEDTPQNSPAHRVQPELQNIDLHDTTPTSPSNMLRDMPMSAGSMYASPLPGLQFSGTRSRRSSIGSTTSDASSIFGLLDAPVSPPFHLQSDWESEASEQGSSAVLETVSKEQLLGAYRRIQGRYHKYKGRFNDLAKYYRQMERDLAKTRNVLAASQDKALRRISELKEQCQLEQTAKAHLEEALRNDLEEKDHKIKALQTKLEILKSGSKPEELESSFVAHNSHGTSSGVNGEQEEVLALRDKVAALEAKQLKFRDALLQYKDRVERLVEEKSQVEQERDATKNELTTLAEQASNLRKQQEEAALSLAENKQQIHVELEAREMEVQRLQASLTNLASERDLLASKAKDLQDGHSVADQPVPSKQELQELQTKLIESEYSLAEQTTARNFVETQLKKKEEELEAACQEAKQMEAKMQEGIVKLQEIQSTVTNNQMLEQQVTESKMVLQEKEKELTCLQAQLIELNNKIDDSDNNSSLVKSLQCNVDQQKEEIQQLSQELKQYHSTNESLLEIKETLQTSLDNLKLENENCETNYKKEIKSLNKINSDLKNELLHTAGQYTDVNSQCEETKKLLEEKTGSFGSAIQEMERKNAELLDEMDKLKHGKEYVETKMEELCKELQKSNNKYQQLAQEKSEMESKYEASIKEIQEGNDKSESNFMENNNLIQKLEEEKEKLSNIIKQFETEINQLKTEMEYKDNTHETMTSEVHTLLNSLLLIEDNAMQLSDLKIEEKWQILTENFHKISMQNSALIEEKNNFNKSYDDLNKIHIDIQDQLKVAASDKDNLLKKLKKQEEIEIELTKNLETSNKKIQDVNLELEGLKQEKEKIKKVLEKFKTTKQQNKNEIDKLKSELQEIKLKHENLESSKMEANTGMELMQNKNTELENKIDELIQINTDLQTEIQGANNELQKQEALQTELTRTKEVLENANDLKAKLVESKAHIQSLEKELQKMHVKFEKVSDEYHLINKNLYDENSTLERVNKEIIKELEVRKNGNQQLILELEEARTVLDTSNKELNASLAEKSELESNLEIAKSKISELILNLQDARVQSKSSESYLKENESILEAMKLEFNETKTNYESKLTELHTQLENVTLQLKESNFKMEESELKVNQLKTELEECKPNYETQVEELNRQVQVFKAKYENSTILAQENENKFSSASKELDACYLKHESQIKEMSKEAEEVRNEHERIALDLRERIRQLEQIQVSQENAVSEQVEVIIKEIQENQDKEIQKMREKHGEEIESIKHNMQRNMQDLKIAHTKELTASTEDCWKQIKVLRNRVKELERDHNQSLQIAVGEKVKELNELENKMELMKQEYTSTINEQRIELSDLQEKMLGEQKKTKLEISTLKEKLSNAETLLMSSADNTNQEIVIKLQEELKQMEDDHSVTLELATQKYEGELLTLRETIEGIEDQHNMQLKLVIKDYENQLAKSEELHRQELEEFAEKKQRIESSAARQLREQSRELLQETKDTEAAYESQIKELQAALKKAESSERDTRTKAQEEAKKVQQKLDEAKREARAALQAELSAVESKHKEHMEAMIKEWQFERKSENGTTSQPEDLEKTSQLAVAAMESSSATVELLQHQLMARAIAHRETAAAQGSSSQVLDPALELAYLRNVLYEYMMGKQPLVLAKVIAAVARFDAEQTQNVIHKEEQKQTLLGQFGII